MFLVDSFEEIQENIKERLDENTEFFTKHCNNLTQNHFLLSSCLADISTIFELERERMDGSLDRAHAFSGELERVAGDIILLASERREITLTITKKRQLQMISIRIYLELFYFFFSKWTGKDRFSLVAVKTKDRFQRDFKLVISNGTTFRSISRTK